MRTHLLKRSLVLLSMVLALAGISSAGILLQINIAPPPLPIYDQPLCPGDGYLWTPGYWAYGDDGFFWVPGTWVLIPEPGLLWTPGWWGWDDGGFYLFHEGFWGPHVGFYGGINYGFGYVGFGYEGGYWDHGAFFYNRYVNHVEHVTNVYNKTVINNITVTNVSYNGGSGGITARPRPEEEIAMRERHIPPSSVQVQHVQAASTNRQLYENVNHGKPPVAATPRPAEFSGRGVVQAKAAARNYVPPQTRAAAAPVRNGPPAPAARNAPAAQPERNVPAGRPGSPAHASEIQSAQRPGFTPSGNQRADQKFQQQQQKLYAQQDKERQKLQQQQEREHQQFQSHPNPQRQQQIEQRHQQQTQQLQQRHESQAQQMQSRAPQPRR
ncbi:MAG TPA: YXWGXW repeat-containing protein [Bryobacteraceae bacterium]|nr:YXWGXW repeat-containing protein [Bryobacteraceae bacterium]